MVAVSYSALAGAGDQFFDNSGNILTGGFIYTYLAGSTTPATTYQSSAGVATNANPIELDSAGRPPAEIWLATSSNYKFVITNATGSQSRTYDNVPGVARAADLADFIALIEGQTGSDYVGFLQAGTGAEPRTVQDKLRELEVSVYDYMTEAEISACQAYSFGTDVTSAVNDAVDYAYRNALRLRFPPGGYLVSQIVLPDNPASDPRAYGFEMVGAGHGEAFVYSNPRGTVIRGSSAVLSTLKFEQTAPNYGSGDLLIHQIRFEGTQNATVPCVELEALYGQSRFWDCDIYQFGQGDGLYIGQMAAAEVANCCILNGYLIGGSPSWAVPGNVAHPGTGVKLTSDLNCGLATFRKCTSRGWDLGWDLGDSSNLITLFSTKLDGCEGSNNKKQVYVRQRQWKTVIDSCYFESSYSTYGVLNEGNYTTISNTDFSTEHLICIDDSSTSNIGTVITGNNLQATSAGPCTLVKLGSSSTYAGPGKTCTGNSFVWSGSGGSVAGVCAIQIDGTQPNVYYAGNAFSPGTAWTGGAGTARIIDNSAGVALWGSGQRALIGFGQVDQGSQIFPALNQVQLSLGVADTTLGDSAISGGILTTGGGSFFKLDLTAATNIDSVAKTQQGLIISIWSVDANPTFKQGANIKLSGSADFTPGASGAIITFISNGTSGGKPILYELARTSF